MSFQSSLLWSLSLVPCPSSTGPVAFGQRPARGKQPLINQTCPIDRSSPLTLLNSRDLLAGGRPRWQCPVHPICHHFPLFPHPLTVPSLLLFANGNKIHEAFLVPLIGLSSFRFQAISRRIRGLQTRPLWIKVVNQKESQVADYANGH